MGLFDKRDRIRKKDDFDSPVESIDLSGQAQGPLGGPDPGMPGSGIGASAGDGDDDYDLGMGAGFGIDKAIQLMRTLPADNVELVVQVVKLTLESTKIKIASIIDDATRKQDDIQGRIKILRDEIADFEKEIAQRKSDIGTMEKDYEETTSVKEQLILAERLTSKTAAPGRNVTSSMGMASAKASGTIAENRAPDGRSLSSDRPSSEPISSPTGSAMSSTSSPLGSQSGKTTTVIAKK